jgi:hypothetical protein
VRKIFQFKWENVTRGWIKGYDELLDLQGDGNNVRVPSHMVNFLTSRGTVSFS